MVKQKKLNHCVFYILNWNQRRDFWYIVLCGDFQFLLQSFSMKAYQLTLSLGHHVVIPHSFTLHFLIIIQPFLISSPFSCPEIVQHSLLNHPPAVSQSFTIQSSTSRSPVIPHLFTNYSLVILRDPSIVHQSFFNHLVSISRSFTSQPSIIRESFSIIRHLSTLNRSPVISQSSSSHPFVHKPTLSRSPVISQSSLVIPQ